MHFDSFRVNAQDWTGYISWSDDITQRHAYSGLSFVREFAAVYKNHAEKLDEEYRRVKGELASEHSEETSRIAQENKSRCALIENEKKALLAAIAAENNKISGIMNRIRELETANAAAASISDYVSLKKARDADLERFEALQKQRRELADAQYSEKSAQARERYENACIEEGRRYDEKVKELEEAYFEAKARLEREYTELFNTTVMADEKFRQYMDGCKKHSCTPATYKGCKVRPEYIYIGELQMFIPKESKSALAKKLIEPLFGPQAEDVDAPYEIRLPYCQKISEGVGLFITDMGNQETNIALRKENKHLTFEDEIPMLLMRAFMSFPGGKLEAFTVDSGKMGAVFHDLLRLGGEESRVIGDASSTFETIESTLSILRSKMDGIANNYGAEFEARMYREPYYALAISNFPEGFNIKSLQMLSAIIKNASACGVAVYILAAKNRMDELSGEAKIIADEIMKTLHRTVGDNGVLKCQDAFVSGDVNVVIDGIYDYDRDVLDGALDIIQGEIRRHKAPLVTLEDIMPRVSDMNTWMSMDTSHGIRIPVGIKGAADVVSISLGASGANSEHHMLIEGSTGAGKSSFLHAMIMSTLINYSPTEVEVFLVDFKSGVEFKVYADYAIPSLRIVSVESEREFGLQVFKALEGEFDRRAAEFKATGATGTAAYREITHKPMPKILLIIDEYQELFAVKDDIAHECERILNTLVLEGRAMGIHIILATQNIKQAAINNEIYQQMSVRIALKGSENVLAPGNDGTRLLVNSSDGTTIYNGKRGEPAANKVFQAVYLGDSDYREELLEKVSALQLSMQQEGQINVESSVPNKVLYTNIEDNRKHCLNEFVIGGKDPEPLDGRNDRVYALFLGEAYELSEKMSIGLLNQRSSNMFISVSPQQLTKVLVNSVVSLLYSDLACKNATRGNRLIHFANMCGEEVGAHITKLESMFPESVKYAAPESADNDWAVNVSGYEGVKELIDNTYSELCKRRRGEYDPDDRIVFIMAGMDRIDTIANLSAYEKAAIDEYAIEAGGAQSEKNAMEKIMEIIEQGPEFGINCIMSTNDINATSRLYGERFYDEFALRVVQRLTEKQMEEFAREFHADTIKPNTLVFYKKGSQVNKKFRAYEVPGEDWMRNYAERYHAFAGGAR